jgi:hypothetical protein
LQKVLPGKDTGFGKPISKDLGDQHGGKMEKEHGRSQLNLVAPKNGPSAVPAEGAAVLKEVVQMTGLPEEYLDSEITQFLGTATESVNDLTLDQLRSVLLNYLETVNEEMTQELERH